MAMRDNGTEQLIKDTAKRIFFAEGKTNATTQDIADAAGVTRTLVNYYFRSKDVLFKRVFDEAMIDTRNRFDEVLSAPLAFPKKVEKFIDVFYNEALKFPYKEAFMISEINSHEFALKQKEAPEALKIFLQDIKKEMDNGTIKKMKPMNFMLNLFSLMAYPLLTRPLFQRTFELTDTQYETLLKDRKKMILEILMP
ncbi:TetR/AcrR family transcriptional regulator [Mucilaginibacter glaciei]|uniref:TetR/AcrR family transcriptional regulator n=1 Tax=Mucilaginibacter glaciei TaxID=2772109 RepID=A0A926S2J8_9SPHI|nr:TetR/AcrR family transcriptional regulator [Mucilaginibacter glaciei]MBD1394223.1 TetR/AcrR family transcriptional regulator [Mucilaginibacter glaciei]